MINSNGIVLAIKFYRKQRVTHSLGWVLAVTGVSGILETLPILLSLPLIRTLFLNSENVALGNVQIELLHYVAVLLALLLVRLLIGIYSQFINASTRIRLLAEFRANSSSAEREKMKTIYGKSVQSINFLLVGWSQLLPGILFTTAGIAIFPSFGIIIISILLLWLIPMRILKKQQDESHVKVSALQANLEEDITTIALWRDARFKAAKLDSFNKNLREFIIVSTLIIALFVAHAIGLSFAGNSILVILMLLRGLQQLFTSYIMTQQVVALKGYLTEFSS
ncbi:hypothetical protein OAW78_01380 [Schleiferiaceae bacterium]|nr:hypothetical protein [Schleiferiaceae bacterium]